MPKHHWARFRPRGVDFSIVSTQHSTCPSKITQKRRGENIRGKITHSSIHRGLLSRPAHLSVAEAVDLDAMNLHSAKGLSEATRTREGGMRECSPKPRSWQRTRDYERWGQQEYAQATAHRCRADHRRMPRNLNLGGSRPRSSTMQNSRHVDECAALRAHHTRPQLEQNKRREPKKRQSKAHGASSNKHHRTSVSTARMALGRPPSRAVTISCTVDRAATVTGVLRRAILRTSRALRLKKRTKSSKAGSTGRGGKGKS